MSSNYEIKIEIRAEQAEELWQRGKQLEAQGEYKQAYDLFTEAHDLTLDCARLHQYAHVQLKRINWKTKNYYEWMEDTLLLKAAPLGVFDVVSYFARSGSFGLEFCKR